jgi:hypothetical protein
MKKRRKMVIDVVCSFMWDASCILSQLGPPVTEGTSPQFFWLGVVISVSAFITVLRCCYGVFFKLSFTLRLDTFDIVTLSRINSCTVSF